MYKPPSHHFHRDPSRENLNPSEKARATEIAMAVLKAFAITTQQESNRISLDTCTDRYRKSIIFIPQEPPGSVAQTGYCCTYHDTAVPIALSEIALEWREKGLIDRYCDIYRWNRSIKLGQHQAQITEALKKLGIPHTSPGHDHVFPKPVETIHPDPTALFIAKQFQQMIKHYESTVTLFGSRARGDHRPDSDIDLLIDVTDTPEAWETAEAAAYHLEQAHPEVDIDINIVVGTINPIYRHPAENLQNPEPNAITFSSNRTTSNILGIHNQPPQEKLKGGMATHFMVASHLVYKMPHGGTRTLDVLDLKPCNTL